ncbi:MAG: hypothetical protein AAGK09_14060 [Planctomycetota bacterium]
MHEMLWPKRCRADWPITEIIAISIPVTAAGWICVSMASGGVSTISFTILILVIAGMFSGCVLARFANTTMHRCSRIQDKPRQSNAEFAQKIASDNDSICEIQDYNQLLVCRAALAECYNLSVDLVNAEDSAVDLDAIGGYFPPLAADFAEQVWSGIYGTGDHKASREAKPLAQHIAGRCFTVRELIVTTLGFLALNKPYRKSTQPVVWS